MSLPVGATKTTLLKMFKDQFFQGDLTRHGDIDTPLGNLITKKDKLRGSGMTWPFNYTDNEAIGPSLDAINPVPQSTSVDRWKADALTDTSYMYGRITYSIPDAMLADGGPGSYFKIKALQTAGLLNSMKEQRLGVQVWGDGASNIGITAANVTGATDTFALTVLGDAVKFKKGMKLQANPNRTGNAGTLRVDVYQVTGVERLSSAGTAIVSVSRYSGAADDWTAGDFVYRYGFYDSAMKGIQAFITASKPGTGGVPATLFNLDRTDEPEMKAGWRGIWQGSIQETVLYLCAVMGQYFSPQFSSVWLSPLNWHRLAQELRGSGTYVIDDEASLKFGTKVLTFVAPGGSVKVVSDPFTPDTDAFLLRHNEIEILTCGPLIHICDEDLEALRLPNADALELRYRSMALMMIPYPWKCGRAPII
jgi:hypothetical protein